MTSETRAYGEAHLAIQKVAHDRTDPLSPLATEEMRKTDKRPETIASLTDTLLNDRNVAARREALLLLSELIR